MSFDAETETLTCPEGEFIKIKCANCTINSLTSDNIQTNFLNVSTQTSIGGNNYVTPDKGKQNYVLVTDGNGSTRWEDINNLIKIMSV